MKPTTNLRFVERDLGYTKIRVLQQWWAFDPDSHYDWTLKVNGEWRDIPLEKEE